MNTDKATLGKQDILLLLLCASHFSLIHYSFLFAAAFNYSVFSQDRGYMELKSVL